MARPELEFFILSIVYQHEIPFAWIGHPDTSWIWSRIAPKFTPEELIDALFDLFRGGDLFAFLDRPCARNHPFVPTQIEIDAALSGALDLRYGLTPQGGARWEEIAQFNWNSEFSSRSDGEFEGLSQEAVEHNLIHSRNAVPGSEQWSTVRPWEATYWKSFPEGVRVRYEELHTERVCERLEPLWLDGWPPYCDVRMRKFVPMKDVGPEPVEDRDWRIALRLVERQTTQELEQLLEHPEPVIQYLAAVKLTEIQELSVVSPLIRWLLRSPTRYALNALSRLRSQELLDALLEVFKMEEPTGAGWPVWFSQELQSAIAAYGQESVRKLAPFLDSGSREQISAALGTLAQTGSVDAGTAILNWLQPRLSAEGDDHDHLIQAGLIALGNLNDGRALPLLEQFLRKNPSEALRVLAHSKDPGKWSLLTSFLQSNTRLPLQCWALSLLTKFDSSYQAEYERADCQRQDEVLRAEIYMMLNLDIQSISERMNALVAVLSDADPKRRLRAITAICRHDFAFPMEHIVKLLDDPEPEVRANAAYAIGLRGSLSDAAVVERMIRDPSALVRYCAREARKLLDGSPPPTPWRAI